MVCKNTMKPSHIASRLRQIAAAIDNSKNPRRDLVARDLQQVIIAVGSALSDFEEYMIEFMYETWGKSGFAVNFMNSVNEALGREILTSQSNHEEIYNLINSNPNIL
jgi:hypothetical protein